MIKGMIYQKAVSVSITTPAARCGAQGGLLGVLGWEAGELALIPALLYFPGLALFPLWTSEPLSPTKSVGRQIPLVSSSPAQTGIPLKKA